MSNFKPRPGCINPDGTFTDHGLMHVLEMSSYGASISEIAKYLRVGARWLKARIDDESEDFDERVFDVYSDGDHEFKKRLREAQANLAQVNATMAIHLGKHYLDQRDKTEIDINHRVQVVGTLPDRAQTPDAWLHQYGPRDQKAIEPVRKLDAVDVEYEVAEQDDASE